MKQLGSNLATAAGLVMLGLLTLLAAYLQIPALLAALLVVWLLCLIAYVWARLALSRLDVSLDGEDSRAFPGEELSVDARLENRKFLPLLWVEARFPLDRDSCVAPAEEEEAAEGERPEEDRALTERFLWVMPQQSIRWQQRAWAVHRGVCRFDSLELASGDGFGLADRRRRISLGAGFRFVVYPAVREVDVSPILRRMSELERFDRGLYTDNTLIKTIRDYQEGDSFRDINWRVLARQGSLQVNVREKLAMRRVCLAADLESFSYTRTIEAGGESHMERLVYGEELERMLSLVASVIVAVHEQGVLCSLVIPGAGEAPARVLTPEVRETQVPELLTALAEVAYRGEKSSFPGEEMLAKRHRLGQLFLFSRVCPGGESAPERSLEGLPLLRVVQQWDEEETAGRRDVIRETDLTG